MSRWWMVLALVLLGLVAVWSWRQAARPDGSPQARAAMYREALENVRARCAPPAPGLESYCREHATLLLDYPECDPACVALVCQIRGEPTR